jgi:hypothetical protein
LGWRAVNNDKVDELPGRHPFVFHRHPGLAREGIQQQSSRLSVCLDGDVAGGQIQGDLGFGQPRDPSDGGGPHEHENPALHVATVYDFV